MRFEITGKASREFREQVVEVAKKYPNLPKTSMSEKRLHKTALTLSQRLFDRLSLDHYEFPTDDMMVIGIRHGKATILLRRMCRIKGVGIYSPRMPRVDGRLVVYTGHAAKRLAKRGVLNWRRFRGWSDAFRLVHDRVYFGDLPERKMLVAWDEVIKEHISFGFARSFTVSGVIPENCHYKNGYLPYIEEGKLLICKTFLPVGFEGTPEGDWMMTDEANKIVEVRKVWREMADNVMTFEGLFEEGGFMVQAMFNRESPYSQLKVFRHPVFDHSPL